MGATTETSVKYLAEARTSQFTVQVFAGGVLSAFGHSPTIVIRDFSAVVQLNSEDLTKSSLKVTINPESLAVRDEVPDKDRREIERTMKQEILETSAYPEIVYDCSNVAVSKTGEGQYSVTCNGDLTMQGITRSKSVSARVALGEDSLRAFGNFSILHSDYGLKLVTIAGGALKVKDELKFSFNILARKE
jgi:polyisoprenoid-binding protein YceI